MKKILPILFSILFSVSSFASDFAGELYRQYLAGEISTQDPSLKAVRFIRTMGGKNIGLSEDWDQFSEELYSPLMSLVNELGYSFYHGPPAFFNPKGLGSLIRSPLEVLPGFKAIKEDFEEFRNIKSEDLDKPITLTNSGRFESAWHFAIGLALFIKKPENINFIRFVGVAVNDFGRDHRLSGAKDYLIQQGDLSSWNPTREQVEEILLVHRNATYYRSSFVIGGVAVYALFKPVLLQSFTFKKTLLEILADDSESGKQEAVIQEIARYFVRNQELPENTVQRALAKDAYEILKRAHKKLGDSIFVYHTFERNPNLTTTIEKVLTTLETNGFGQTSCSNIFAGI